MARLKRTQPSSIAPEIASTNAPVSLELQEEIRRRAYQIYEERGREDGRAEEDWLRAEAEVLHRDKAMAA